MPIFVKIDASMPWNDKVARLSDGQFRAYLKAICQAKQRDSHIFDRRNLNSLLGEHSRHVRHLTRAGLLDVLDGDRLAIHDYVQHQQPIDTTAARRQREWRERKRIERESGSYQQVDNDVDNVTPNALRNDVTVTGQSRAEKKGSTEKGQSLSREAVDNSAGVLDDAELTGLADALIAAGVWQRPTKKMLGFLASLIRDHGAEAVTQGIVENLRIDPSPSNFMDDLAALLRRRAEERTARNEATKVEFAARQAERDQAEIEKLRAQPGAEEAAAARRKAIADFGDGLGFPGPEAPRPRGSTAEGRAR